MRVLVTEKLSEQGLELLRTEFRVDVRTDLAAGDLVAAIPPYEALIIRSATRVTAEVLDAATNLRVVARAGIGLDNVDVDAATRRGVMVVNAPQSNVMSAAEHALALLLAQARNIPQAHEALKAGTWERRGGRASSWRARRSASSGSAASAPSSRSAAGAFGMRG